MPTDNTLVVEDEENIQELIRYHLAKEGYQVTWVPSGEKGLGFKFKCLCINHAYEIGPGEVWYRVVLLKVSPNFEGDSLILTHHLVGLDPKRFSRFSIKKRRPGF